MKSIKGTRTEQNLLIGFAGESQARNRYNYYASVAKKEGYVQVSEIFTETADQEKEHAKRLFKFLEGGDVDIKASFPAGMIRDTSENLADAAKGEDYEWQVMYPEFAKVAREEGFNEIADVFEAIAIAEKQHSKRFLGVKELVDAATMFKKTEPVVWRCMNCGYIVESKEAPGLCPACAHSQAHFEILFENW